MKIVSRRSRRSALVFGAGALLVAAAIGAALMYAPMSPAPTPTGDTTSRVVVIPQLTEAPAPQPPDDQSGNQAPAQNHGGVASQRPPQNEGDGGTPAQPPPDEGTDEPPPNTTTTPPTDVQPPAGAQPTNPEEERWSELDRQLGLLRQGEIVRDVPSPMQQGESYEVVVRATDEQGSAVVLEGLPGDDVVREPALIGTDLVAELAGDDFAISRVGGDNGQRVLGLKNYAEWRWNVRPLKSGTLKLQIALYVRMQEGGSPLDVRIYHQTVTVPVSPLLLIARWLQDNWAATGLSVPVVLGSIYAAVRWSIRRFRKRPAIDTSKSRPVPRLNRASVAASNRMRRSNALLRSGPGPRRTGERPPASR